MRKFEKVSYSDEGIIPTRADSRSAGYDFYAPLDVFIPSKKIAVIRTYIKAYMPEDEVLMIYPRSSIGIKEKLMLANSTGIIDSSYVDNPDNEGNILIAFYNYGDGLVHIKAGDRIAQGVFVKYFTTENDKPLKDSRTGGIGSSGS